jgi:endoglucanase
VPLTLRRRPGRLPGRPRMLWALLVALLLAISACSTDAGDDGVAAPRKSGAPAAAVAGAAGDFVRAEGRGLVLGGQPVRLESVNFSNNYHRNLAASDLLASPHHTEEDFARVAELGFNSVRFAFDGDWYAEDPDVFWQWLDQNVGWAREHGIYLVLDLHTPIGGFWLDPTSDQVSFDIWTDEDLQQQNADMWRQIGTRYAAEPHIAAYDLLNEPVTVDEDGQQWKDLAAELVAAVREVDPNHLLVIGGIYGVDGKYGATGIDSHFLVDDDNVVYDFHFYEPIKYTHQYASWVEGPIQDGGAYPEPETILPTGERVWVPAAIATPPLAAGTSDWRLYDSGIVAIDDPAAVAAIPVVYADGGMRGKAWFDSITVTEYGPDGAEIGTVVDDQLDRDGTLDWYSWEDGGKGGAPAELVRESTGHQDDGSLSVADARTKGAIAGWSNDGHLFTVVPGNQYRIQGYMRGEDVDPSGSAIGVRLDVYGASPGAPAGGFIPRDQSYLEYELIKHVQWGIDNDVPMSVMEFGVVRQAFQMEGKGGDAWVTDMLALFEQNDLSFAYWEYHGAEMGLWLTAEGPPGEPNAGLMDVLRRELA